MKGNKNLTPSGSPGRPEQDDCIRDACKEYDVYTGSGQKPAHKDSTRITAGQIPLDIPLIVQCKNDLPAIELRRLTTDTELIKLLVRCAFHIQPITIQPMFTNRMMSLNALLDHGIIYREGDQFFFNF